MGKNHYRPDIDGLRAIAVIPVLLFHASLPWFSGGFVGVDVFFVISGFLITSLLASELDAGKFSLVRFWERRVRRIVPALLAVIAFCLVCGWFIFLPADFRNLGQSAFAQTVFSSNILFWLESGYFDAPSELKPLLHTWSLSVEEQYYLLFPPILAALTLLGRRRRLQAITCAALVSFAFSVWAVAHQPSAAFYILPARGWELLLGAYLALAGAGHLRATWLRETIALLGIASIIASIGFYQPSTPFPGVAALLPCLGTAFVIWSGIDGSTWVKHVLSMRALVAIGLISYSLYLWHWPVLVFLRYRSPLAPPSGLEVLLALLACVALAWMSWRFVEMPFRTRKLLPGRWPLLMTMSAALLCIGLFGLSGYLHDGYPNRLPAEVRRYAEHLSNPRRAHCHLDESSDLANLTPCELGDPADKSAPLFMALGDSHLDATAPVLDALAAKWRIKGIYLSYSGCPALLGTYRVDLPPTHRCREFNEKMVAVARSLHIKNVILLSQWSVYTLGWEHSSFGQKAQPYLADASLKAHSPAESQQVFSRGIHAMVAALAAAGVQTWIVEQVPQHKVSIADTLEKLRIAGSTATITRPLADHLERQAGINAIFAQIPSSSVHILDPTNCFCSRAAGCLTERSGRPLYKDDHHLTPFGSMQLRPLLDPLFAGWRPLSRASTLHDQVNQVQPL